MCVFEFIQYYNLPCVTLPEWNFQHSYFLYSFIFSSMYFITITLPDIIHDKSINAPNFFHTFFFIFLRRFIIMKFINFTVFMAKNYTVFIRNSFKLPNNVNSITTGNFFLIYNYKCGIKFP